MVQYLFLVRSSRREASEKQSEQCNHTCQLSEEWKIGDEPAISPFCHLCAETQKSFSALKKHLLKQHGAADTFALFHSRSCQTCRGLE